MGENSRFCAQFHYSADSLELRNQSGIPLLRTELTFKTGKPEALIEISGVGLLFQYIGMKLPIRPDGQRFLMMKPAGATDGEIAEASPRKINVVLNWFEELKERVPVP